MKPVTLERKIDELYRLPLEQFIAERDALVKRLRGSGDTEAAARVNGLAKPSLPAWMANQVFWKARRPFTRLMESGQALRRLQQGPRGPDALRAAVEQRTAAMDAVRKALREHVYPAGKPPPPAMLRRLEGTLEAMAALGAEALDPPPGRLSQEIEPPGFGVLFPLLPGGPAASPSKKRGTASGTTPARETRREAGERAQAAARARLQRVESELELREAAAARSATDRARCDEELQRARDEERQARQRLELARKRVRKTSVELQRAAKELDRARIAARRARKKRDEARRAAQAHG